MTNPDTPGSHPGNGGAFDPSEVEVAQEARRVALIGRLGTIADLACQNPLPGELGDVAYDLLRKAAAQISSDRLRIRALSTRPTYADGVEAATNAVRCRTSILREWFGGKRYARDYEYLDHNYGDQAQRVAEYLTAAIRSLAEPVGPSGEAGR